MTRDLNASKKRKKGLKNLIPVFVVLILLIGIPIIFLNYQAQRNGLSWSEVIQRTMNKKTVKTSEAEVNKNNTEGQKIDFLTPIQVGNEFTEHPLVSQILSVDLDNDGLLDVIVCDCKNNTVSWTNVEQYIRTKNKEIQKVPFEIGADVLLKYSYSEESDIMTKIGKLVRDTRLKSGMTQQELALVSGTSRTYISRIENDRSDIELATLRKIIETGLGKRLEINVR